MGIKRFFILVSLALIAFSANAQEDYDKNIFNHLSVGVTGGTPGIGADVAMPVCNYVQVRAGFSVMPKFTFSTDLEISETPYDLSYVPNEISVEAKTGFTNGKLLFDIYPFKSSGFHITAGAYFGGGSVIKGYNKEDGLLKEVADYNKRNPNNMIGYELGDYLLTPDRAVPKKRLGFMFELGVMFWGSPKVYCNGDELTSEDLGSDGGEVMKVLSKIKVYPVLNFRLCGRIF